MISHIYSTIKMIWKLLEWRDMSIEFSRAFGVIYRLVRKDHYRIFRLCITFLSGDLMFRRKKRKAAILAGIDCGVNFALMFYWFLITANPDSFINDVLSWTCVFVFVVVIWEIVSVVFTRSLSLIFSLTSLFHLLQLQLRSWYYCKF